MKIFLLLIIICISVNVFSQTSTDSIFSSPKLIDKSLSFDGTLKTRIEMSTDSGMIRFNVRNTRFGFRGNISEELSYRVQMELSNEGVFQILDIYGTLKPTKNFSFLLGQQLIPFENSYIITPSELMFANRTFVGKFFTPGTRDIGAVAQYKFSIGGFPMEGQIGLFNGGRINNPTWTSRPSFACRLIAGSMDGFRASAKVYKYYREPLPNVSELNILLTGTDVHYDNNRLRVEAELMNRHSYNDGLDLSGAYIQGAYTVGLPNAKMFNCLTPVLRWDAMGYDFWKSSFDVNRLTAGINFGLTIIPFDSLIRINYEQYFVPDGLVFPDFDNLQHVADNKLTVELLIKF